MAPQFTTLLLSALSTCLGIAAAQLPKLVAEHEKPGTEAAWEVAIEALVKKIEAAKLAVHTKRNATKRRNRAEVATRKKATKKKKKSRDHPTVRCGLRHPLRVRESDARVRV